MTFGTMQIDQLIGRQIEDYLIEERIGRGGMSTVYRATQLSMRRAVALKVITLDPSMDNPDEFKARFAREAELVATLEHLHIMPVYDYGIIGTDMAYLAMRLLRGGTLAQVIAGTPLPFDRTLHIFRQVASGLDYAHQNGIIHRDLKPSNILFDDLQNAYLADFGLAKLVQSSQQLTQSGSVVGTPMYMSPEQLRGEAIDHRSDIYGMGVLLYHMLAGAPPYSSADGNLVAIIYQHLEHTPRPLREYNPQVPDVVESVVLTALAKQPTDRFSSVGAMAVALQTALERSATLLPDTTPVVPHTPPFALRLPSSSTLPQAPFTGSTTFTPRSPLRSPALVGGAVMLVIVLLAAVALFLAQQRAIHLPSVGVVTAGEIASAESITPTTDQIATAQVRLGEDGFIAYVTCNTTSEYHATQTREMGDMAQAYGLRYRTYDSNTDKSQQIPLIERARLDGAVGLIVCPLDPLLLDETLDAVDAANMPLVLMNGSMDSHGGVLIAGDEYRIGLEAGHAAGDILLNERRELARVIILDYPDLEQIIVRANGLEDGIRERLPNVQIVGRFLGATQDNGYNSVRQLIEDGVRFDAILSINDAGSIGAIRALDEAGIPPQDVIITSIDADATARAYIRDGYYLRASVDVGRMQFSRAAVDSMVRLLSGSAMPETVLAEPGELYVRETDDHPTQTNPLQN